MRRMKKLFYIIIASTTLLLTGCLSENDPFAAMQEGTGRLALSIQADGKMQTRATEGKPLTEEQQGKFLVSIKRGNTVVLAPTVFNSLTADMLTVPTGSGYFVMAESCSETDAENGYGHPWLVGEASELTVAKDQETKANLLCTPINAGVDVTMDESFSSQFNDYTLNATYGSRTLTFTQNNTGITGYYNVPTNGATLSYTLTATRKTGGNANASGTIALQRGKITRMVLKSSEKGYINLTITYDDHFVTENIDLIIDTETQEGESDEMPADPSQQTNVQLIKQKR